MDNDRVFVGMGVSECTAAPLIARWNAISESMKTLSLNAREAAPFPHDCVVAVRQYPNRPNAVDPGPEPEERLRIVKGTALSPNFAAVDHSQLIPAVDGSPLCEIVHLPSGRGLMFVDRERFKVADMVRFAGVLEGSAEWGFVRCATPIVSRETSKAVMAFKPALPGLKSSRLKRGEGAPLSDDGCSYNTAGEADSEEVKLCPSCGRDHRKTLFDGPGEGTPGREAFFNLLDKLDKAAGNAGMLSITEKGGFEGAPDEVITTLMMALTKEVMRRAAGGKRKGGKGGKGRRREDEERSDGED